jgi:PAS domain S-box-containing protein
MRTLASNASTLITNAKLLATVENGRRRLSAIISSTADAVLATNESNRIMLLNDAMEQYFDIKTRDVLGKKLETVLENEELVEALSANGSSPSRIEVTATDGHVLDGQVSTLNYNGGTSAGSVVVLRDVTRFKQLDEMKTDFVANVSHDLRSPLTQMLTYSQLIPMDGPLTDNQVKWLSRVERAVVDMKDLIEVLLDLNRLESGVTLVTVPFRIEEIFRAIVEDFNDEASANGITIKYETEEFLPVIDGDVDLIKQAIRNIVSNGIKYAPNSGDLVLSAKSKGDFINISVSDNGPGIAESDVARVFEKFYRTESQNNGKVSGRGLGLALVKSIAERHGGKAWCESQLAVGSRFYLSLPINNIGQKNIRKGTLKQPVKN